MALNFSFDNIKPQVAKQVAKGTNTTTNTQGQIVEAQTDTAASPLQAKTGFAVSPDQAKMVGTPLQKTAAIQKSLSGEAPRNGEQVRNLSEAEKTSEESRIQRLKAAEEFGSLTVKIDSMLATAAGQSLAGLAATAEGDTGDKGSLTVTLPNGSTTTVPVLSSVDQASIDKFFSSPVFKNAGLNFTSKDLSTPAGFNDMMNKINTTLTTNQGKEVADVVKRQLNEALNQFTASAMLSSNNLLDQGAALLGKTKTELDKMGYADFLAEAETAMRRDSATVTAAEAAAVNPYASKRNREFAQLELLRMGKTGEYTSAKSAENLANTIQTADDVQIDGKSYGSLKEVLESPSVSGYIMDLFDKNATPTELASAKSFLSSFNLGEGKSLFNTVEKFSSTFKTAVESMSDEETDAIRQIHSATKEFISDSGLSEMVLGKIAPSSYTGVVDFTDVKKKFGGLITASKQGPAATSMINGMAAEADGAEQLGAIQGFYDDPTDTNSIALANNFAANYSTWKTANSDKNKIAAAKIGSPELKASTVDALVGSNEAKLWRTFMSDDAILDMLDKNFSSVSGDIGSNVLNGFAAPSMDVTVRNMDQARPILNKIYEDGIISQEELDFIESANWPDGEIKKTVLSDLGTKRESLRKAKTEELLSSSRMFEYNATLENLLQGAQQLPERITNVNEFEGWWNSATESYNKLKSLIAELPAGRYNSALVDSIMGNYIAASSMKEAMRKEAALRSSNKASKAAADKVVADKAAKDAAFDAKVKQIAKARYDKWKPVPVGERRKGEDYSRPTLAQLEREVTGELKRSSKDSNRDGASEASQTDTRDRTPGTGMDIGGRL